MSVSIETIVQKKVNFQVFGTSFSFKVDGSDNTDNIKLDEIVAILSRTVVGAEYEHSRKDKKKVILFYKQGPQSGYMQYYFNVEADETLEALMKDDKKIKEIISYMYKNKDTLNFNIPANYR